MLSSIVRRLSTSARCLDRAVVYRENGNPASVLQVLTYPNISPPPPSTVNIRFLLSPVNPADINVIEGVYPTKPTKTNALSPRGLGSEEEEVFIAGNEGLARVTAVGEGVHSFKPDDWVVMVKQQTGTWATDKNVGVGDILKVPDAEHLTEQQCATLAVNPQTAYNMLRDFVQLEEGDWVIQNGANSAVGQALIQIASARGIRTINVIRDRPGVDALKETLLKLGATHVLTYEELEHRKKEVMGWTNGRPIRLALNCVGGNSARLITKFLGEDAHLVSYGAMAKEPLSLPVSMFIFKNLTSHGFWQSRSTTRSSEAQRADTVKAVVDLMKEKKLDAPQHEIVTIPAQQSDKDATRRLQDLMKAMAQGRYGKKVLLRIESKDMEL